MHTSIYKYVYKCNACESTHAHMHVPAHVVADMYINVYEYVYKCNACESTHAHMHVPAHVAAASVTPPGCENIYVHTHIHEYIHT